MLTVIKSLPRTLPFCKCSFKNFARKLTGDASACPVKVAVIGSGPAGFYVAQHLLKDPRISIDIYEKFPVPFGLVRFGVAPDHPEVKNVINSFTSTALNNRVSFIGNVSVGSDLTLQQIRDNYNVVVLCYGAAQDKLIGIEGEKLPNVISARRFVGWYNGVPQDRDLSVNLNCNNAVIIGHGNVALDCARILLAPAEDALKKTDITQFSLEKLRKSQIKNVYLVGRRGPLQVSFTIKEFRELTKISNCDVILEKKDFEFVSEDVLNCLPRPRKRLSELLLKISNQTSELNQRKCFVKFFRSPIKIQGDQVRGISSVVFGINQLIGDVKDSSAKVSATNIQEEIFCGLVLTSIGYKIVSIDPTLPIDTKSGVIKNENGKVIGCGPGLYCSGWVGSGPAGVIVNTMNFSFDVGRKILNDINSGEVELEKRPGKEKILEALKQKGIETVHFREWQKIDKLEQELGLQQGKSREKVVDLKVMVETAKKVFE